MTAFKRTGQITDTSAVDQSAVVRARAALADAQALLDRVARERDEKAEYVVVLGNGAFILRQRGSKAATLSGWGIRQHWPEIESCVSFRSGEYGAELQQHAISFANARKYGINDGDIVTFDLPQVEAAQVEAAQVEAAPVIKQENWQCLAESIEEILSVLGNQDLASRITRAFLAGKPADYLPVVVAQCKRIIAKTYNGTERARAESLLETLGNYGLI